MPFVTPIATAVPPTAGYRRAPTPPIVTPERAFAAGGVASAPPAPPLAQVGRFVAAVRAAHHGVAELVARQAPPVVAPEGRRRARPVRGRVAVLLVFSVGAVRGRVATKSGRNASITEERILHHVHTEDIV